MFVPDLTLLLINTYSWYTQCGSWRFISFTGLKVPRAGSTRTSFPDSNKTTGLGHLQVKADYYFQKGLADNTHRTYSSAQRQYLQFCDTHNLQSLPGNESTLLLFVSHLAVKIKPQSIKVYLAAVRALHISHGYNNPLTSTIKLQQTLRGIEREHFLPTKQKLPITFDILCKLYYFIDHSLPTDITYWAAITTAHFLLLRASEFWQ